MSIWEQTGAFSFPADREKKTLERVVIAERGSVQDGSFDLRKLSSEDLAVCGPSSAVITGLDNDDPSSTNGSGIQVNVPHWLLEKHEGNGFGYCAALIFAMYFKAGGDEAVLVVDGVPPVAMINPFSNAPLRDEPFASVLNNVLVNMGDVSNKDGRVKKAEGLKGLKPNAPSSAIGGGCIVHRRTLERLGAESLMEAFEVVWVVEYLGSKTGKLNIDVLYNGAIYRPDSPSNWLQMIKTIAIAKNLNSKNIKEIEVIDESMRNRLLVDWQPNILDRSEYTKTVAQLFAECVAKYVRDPSKELAVIDPAEDYKITYEQLDEWSTKVAIYLQTEVCRDSKQRFGVDAVCALHMHRCADWYVWMIGILKAGGCYLSLDPDFPADRLSYILEDSGAMCLITKRDMIGKLDYSSGPVIPVDEVQAEIVSRIRIPPSVAAAFSVSTENEAVVAIGDEDYGVWSEFDPTAAKPSTPAYMIYTSGSTGKPKGVIVENINCVSFVLSERELFNLGNNHRVIQGFSTSFDASVEEIWLAFASGSTLVCVQKRIMQDSEALQELIVDHHVTVLSTVPTLLATMEPSQLKQLALVIVGGEACNKEVVEMYATGGHRIFVNSYGPTEATVACCAAICNPDEPVTIGRAQPNYYALVLDPETRELLPPGVPGELCMLGPSVTRGYVNREELTKEKFLPCDLFANTQSTHGDDFCRMYRTGDLVRWNPDGNIEFLGRIDSQVKLRGFRIEVSEIENVLCQYKGVTTAVVVLRNDSGMPFLCAYIVGDEELHEHFSETSFRDHLKKSLPAYMIPSRFVPISVLPRSPAGKLDRKGFPAPEPLKNEDAGDGTEKAKPSTPTEFLLMDIWSKHFPGQTLGIDDNFFDIGGHSLLAGKVASEVRKDKGGFDGFSIRYIYSHPTIRQLADSMDTMRSLTKVEPVSTQLPVREEPSMLRRILFMIAHVFTMHCVFMVISAYVFLFLWGYSTAKGTLYNEEVKVVGSISIMVIEAIALVTSAMACTLCYTFVVFPFIKWSIVWRFKEGEYSIWSTTFLQWWAIRALSNVTPLPFMQGTAFANLYLRVMGASVGRNVTFLPQSAFDFDLIDIGDDTGIGHETLIAASEVVDSVLILRPVKIGRCCSVGARCVIKGGSVMEDESMLQHLSLLTENSRLPAGEMWGGSPAAKVGLAPHLHEIDASRRQSAFVGAVNNADTPLIATRAEGRADRLHVVLEAVVALVFLVFWFVVGVLCTGPIMAIFLVIWKLIQDLDAAQFYIVLLGTIGASPFIMAVIIFYVHVVLAALRWIVLPWNVQPGNYSVRSLMYHRKIFFDFLMRVSLFIAHPLYASIFTQYWLRALGVECGSRVECSNLFGFTPGLVKLGSETFVADFVGVNPPTLFRGYMMLGSAEVKDRAFVGNGAVLPSGTVLHEKSLLGLLSHPVKDVEDSATYIGSPAFSIPRNAQNEDVGDQSATFRPKTYLVVARVIWELLRTVSPAACLSICIVFSFIVVSFLVGNLFSLEGFAKVVSLFVWINMFCAGVMILVIKWVVVGKEKPAEYPLWSAGVWRAEFVVDCTTVIGNGTFFPVIRGTPFIAPFFRLLGAKIGKDCYIDTIFFTEPDMVTVGDNCCIGDRVTIQTHLFEDRVMKIEPLNIGNRVSVGPMSIVLYNTAISDGATIGSLSLVMKGEAYPEGTHWEGIPAQRRGIPPVMTVAPPSLPKFNLIPPSEKPASIAPSSHRTKEGATAEGDDVAIAAIADILMQWLTDEGTM